MKKLNKLVAILVALAMMMALAVTSAFATDITAGDDQGSAITNGTADDPANIVVEKVLSLPDGIDAPGTEFGFTVTQWSSNDATEGTAVASTATNYVDPTGINALAATPARAADDTNKEQDATDITAKLFKDTINWPDAGTYYFKVTENVPSAGEGITVSPADEDGYVTVTKTTGDKVETWHYNTNPYFVVVGVAKTSIDGEPVYYTNSIAVTDKDGKVTIKEITVEEPGEGSTTKEVTYYAFDIDNDYSYVEDGLLEVGKTVQALVVEGDDEATAANANFDTTKTFNFHVTVTAPATSDKTSYTATLYNGTTATATTYTFTSGETKDIQLATGQKIVFNDLDVGASYTVTEDDYSAIGYGMKVDTDQAEAALVAAAGSEVAVINEYDSTKDNTQTGLTLNNLPFIVLALVAIGGLVAYVVVRRRNADEA